MIVEFFREQDLSFEQVTALTRAMLTVARIDGVHDHEMVLIREFYESCARAGDPRLEDVAKGAFDIAGAKHLFNTPELSKVFVKTLILLAFADGIVASSENELISQYAEKLGLSAAEVAGLKEATKEFLMSGLAHIQNLDALKDVAKKLS